MASIPPRNTQSILLQPKRLPTVSPAMIMQKMMMQVAITEAIPIFRIFLKEKSSPREKSRKMTPISAQVCTFSRPITDMV